MKNLLNVILLLGAVALSGSVWGQTTLNEGELAIIGIDTPGEDFSFVCFVDIDAGTEIYFTDEEADGDYTINTGEGTVLYTAPTGGITAGTVISYQGNNSDFTTTTDGAMTLGNSGDGIIAYQGGPVGTVTIFLHGVGEDAGDMGSFPGGFSNFILIGADDGEYNGTRTGIMGDLMTAINNSSNWTTSGSGVIPFNTTAFSLTGTTSAPSITNIAPTPNPPSSSETVSVDSDITDDGSIITAELHWGLTSGNLTNTINMSVSSGNTYTTDTDIPAQSAGTSIYYEIYAQDNDSDETTSAEQSYTVSTPSITASTGSLTGFTYQLGSGPSTEQSFDIEGEYLTNDISITPPTNYEISTGTGGSFVASNPITLSQSGGIVNSTTIYVRLKSGLAINTYNGENITASSTGAVDADVNCDGEVTAVSTTCGTETFTNSNATGSYGNGSFTGDNSVTWTYTASRDESTYPINGSGIMLRRSSDNSKIISSNVSGGIGEFTCSLKKAFTGAGDRQVELFVNGVSKGTSIAWDNTTTQTFNVPNIDISGNVTIEIRNITAYQVIVDDISWTCYPGSTNDTDTEAYDSGSQPAASNISSTSTAFTNVFEIEIQDQGTADGLATDITNIRIKPHSTNTADWTDHINDVKLNNGADITIGAPSITDTHIDIPISAGNLQIADGGSDVITVQLQIKNTGITDGTVLSFMVDADDHGYTADASGSDFISAFTLGDFNSNDFTIDVTGSQLSIIQQPSDVEEMIAMSPAVTIAFTDANGNIDTDFSGAGCGIGLSSTTTFDGSAITEVDALNGIATFSNLIFNSSGNGYTLSTTDPDGWGWSNITSNAFNVSCPSITAPVAIAGSAVATNSFTANWNSVAEATGYEIDVYSGGAGSELVLNGGFETGDNTNWPTFETEYQVLSSDGTVTPHSGSYMLKCFASGTRELAQDISFTADGSTQYEVSFWYRYETATDPEKLRIWSSFSTGSYTGDDLEPSTYLNATDTWTKVTYTITPSAGSNTLHLEFRTYSTGNIYMDDISVKATGGSPVYHIQNQDVGNVTSYDVSGLTAGETYYYVVRAYNACPSESVNSNEISVDLACEAPTTEATALSFSAIAIDQMNIDWTAGDGSNHLVVASTSPITGSPSDNTSYSADAIFGSGDILNAGEFVIYAGSGTSVTMTGLASSSEYFIKVFEYNCDGGNEKYLTSSPLDGSETTLSDIPAVSNLYITCETGTTATVSWTVPASGDWDGVIIAIRNSTNDAHSLSDDPASVTADPIFGNGYEFGTTTPHSFVVYKGSGNSVTISGLTQGQDYKLKAYSFYGSEYGGITTTSIASLDMSDVSSAIAIAGNAEATISWSNPSCYDEILVVGRDGLSVSTPVSGDGSSYSPNGIFGNGTDIGTNEYVVYNSTSTNVIATGLTNGNTYHFTIFVRIGSEWSTGVEVTVTPLDVTYFNPGELLIIGFDASIDASSADKVYLTNLVDIKPGTSFMYINSRFEAGAPAGVRTNEWHGGGDDPDQDPGITTITYNGASSLPSGSIISYKIEFAAPYSFEVDGVATTDFSALSNGTAANIATSSGDQTWLLQGIFTDQGNYHTLNGNVLYGMTSREPWVDLSSAVDGNNSGTQRESRLHPDIKCFNLSLATNQEYAYYKNGTSGTPGDPVHDGSMRSILIDIMDGSNWEIGTGDNSLNITEDYSACDISNNANAIGRSFCISTGLNGNHNWLGDIDDDWFNCANWESLHVPNEETDVVFDADICTNSINLTNEDTARCHNITFQGTAANSFNATNGVDKILDVYGDLTINADNLVNMDDTDNMTADGTIIVRGNWDNQAPTNGFNQGNSTVIFMGNTAHTLTNSIGSEEFYNFKINSSTDLTLSSTDLNIENQLSLTDGLIVTGANRVHIQTEDETAITGHSDNSYINGNLRRNVSGASMMNFPVGDASAYQLAIVDIQSATSLTYLDGHFASADLGGTNISGLGLVIDGTPLVSVLDAGYWQVEPNAGASGIVYDISINEKGASNAASIAEQHAVIKRDDAVSDWELQGNHNNSTQSISGNVVTAKVSSLGAFSQFAIARSQTNVLAVELIDFTANCVTAGVLIEWSTATEDNSDYFIVEYSSDTKEWKETDRLVAFGSTTIQQDYQLLIEDAPLKGYYRLSEVDMDGTKTIYPAQFINCFESDNKVLFTLSPNPATRETRLIATNSKSNLYLVSICDANGKVINNINWTQPSESNLDISLDNYNSGLYHIRIFNETEYHTLRLIIQ